MSNSNLFHVIDGAQIVLHGKNGVFRQSKIFRRGDHLFAGFGSGFLRLYREGGTSHPHMRWDHIEADFDTPRTDKMGRLCLPNGA